MWLLLQFISGSIQKNSVSQTSIRSSIHSFIHPLTHSYKYPKYKFTKSWKSFCRYCTCTSTSTPRGSLFRIPTWTRSRARGRWPPSASGCTSSRRLRRTKSSSGVLCREPFTATWSRFLNFRFCRNLLSFTFNILLPWFPRLLQHLLEAQTISLTDFKTALVSNACGSMLLLLLLPLLLFAHLIHYFSDRC